MQISDANHRVEGNLVEREKKGAADVKNGRKLSAVDNRLSSLKKSQIRLLGLVRTTMHW